SHRRPVIPAMRPPAARSRPDLLRSCLVGALGRAMRVADYPVLVDDSQTFGALIRSEYDQLPEQLRVFGSHGGFVGSGIAYSSGLALAHGRGRQLCTLGDQAFANSFQGLVVAAHRRAPITFLICNNGSSVSLRTQASSDRLAGLVAADYLDNPASLDYS